MSNPAENTTARILRACDALARYIGVEAPIKILLVEDAPDYAAVFKAMLSRVVGTTYGVDVVADARSAAEEIKKGRHDLYVIDLRLGSESGVELVRTLQKGGHHFPFIMLTCAEGDDRVAMGHDCMMWVHKTDCVSPDELDRVLRYALKNWITRASLHEVTSNLPPGAVPA